MDTRTGEFVTHLQEGGLVEGPDWDPHEYRPPRIKLIWRHRNSEF